MSSSNSVGSVGTGTEEVYENLFFLNILKTRIKGPDSQQADLYHQHHPRFNSQKLPDFFCCIQSIFSSQIIRVFSPQSYVFAGKAMRQKVCGTKQPRRVPSTTRPSTLASNELCTVHFCHRFVRYLFLHRAGISCGLFPCLSFRFFFFLNIRFSWPISQLTVVWDGANKDDSKKALAFFPKNLLPYFCL